MDLQYSAPEKDVGKIPESARRTPGGALAGVSGIAVGGALWRGIGRRAASLANALFFTVLLVAILLGWLERGEGHLTAEEGLGYLLGIVGSVMMLLLLVYPLRKRIRGLRAIGSVRHWFRIHMLFGITGPALILFHANFSLGSTNSTIASLSMATVVLSGLIGRYLYARVHHGLYGQKAAVRELLAEAVALRPEIETLLTSSPGMHDELAGFEQTATAPPGGLMSSLGRSAALSRSTRRAQRRLLRKARQTLRDSGAASGSGWRQRRLLLADIRYALEDYFAAIRKAAMLAVFERLFALWHVLHLPLFFMLVLTAIAHVVAVHLY